jgi:hypothetical protein
MGGRQLRAPAGADPVVAYGRLRLLGAQGPGDPAARADLVIQGHYLDRELALELAADLALQRWLVGLNNQEDVGTLLLEVLKHGF